MSRLPSYRQTFVCTSCGLRLAGRVLTDGRIVADDRLPSRDGPPAPCTCWQCETARLDHGA